MTAAILMLSAGVMLLVYASTGLAARSGLFSDQVTARSNHLKPTSRAGGGLIIVWSALAVALFSLSGLLPSPPVWFALVLAAGGLGGFDDAFGLKALPKLLVLLGIAITGVWMIGPLDTIPLPMAGSFGIPMLMGWLMSVIFIVGFVNAFNFMDGLNGIASGTALVGCLLVILMAGSDDGGLIIAAVIIGSAIFGFALRNISVGTIFLGDAGSLSLGMFTALAAIHITRDQNLALWCLVLAYVPFLVDTITTFLRRLRAGAPVMEAHREHYYQRLRARGWSHQAIALAYTSLSACGGLVGYGLWRAHAGDLILPAGLLMVTIYVIVIRFMFKRDAPQS